MKKRIIFIHGRGIKPEQQALEKLWFDAVLSGLQRDNPLVAEKFQETEKDFVYFGDISNHYLNLTRNTPIPDDIDSRLRALTNLKSYRKEQFNNEHYRKVKGLGIADEIADLLSGPLSLIGLGEKLIELVAPDMGEYWNHDSYFGSEVRYRLTSTLTSALQRGEQIMLVAHSLGSLICWDNLWKLSHYGEYRHQFGANKKVDLFVSLGSPIGNNIVAKNLKGRSRNGAFRYPHNIHRWVNIAAKDDFVSHDNRIADDFVEMYKLGLLSQPIEDISPIYNLTVSNEKSNPHSALGYLISPEFASLLADWLKS